MDTPLPRTATNAGADPIEYRPSDRMQIIGQAAELQGDLLLRQDRIPEAIRAYEQAAAKNPVDGALAFRLAKALQSVGKKAPAAAQAQRALKLGGDKAPYAADVFLMLGDMSRERHNRAEALRQYRRYLEVAAPNAAERQDVERFVDRGGR